MDESVTPAAPGTYMTAVHFPTAFKQIREEILAAQGDLSEPPHPVDLREWIKESWRSIVGMVPVIAWRMDAKTGVLPLLAGPHSKELDSFYLYSASGEKRRSYSRGFIILPDGNFWNGSLKVMKEPEVVTLWSEEVLAAITAQIAAEKRARGGERADGGGAVET
ncbi:hypothetical protein [Limibacillus halophilus]|uniref:Uncharacterized protein n=1 Tax=Limibacillus halophilus TaxID=1579333 RepID=A0A839SMH1_9PROT|nr:hypothetical protein [Limibacillus halophilus]MBB3064097.1 hypothetical protein [Limibacillus halophilus]